MSQNSGACDLFHRAIEKETIIKIALPYTEKEKFSYKPFLKELIHDRMQAFPVNTESH